MDAKNCLSFFYKTQNMNTSNIFFNSNLNISNLLFNNEKYQKDHTYYSPKNIKVKQNNKLFRSSSVLNNFPNKKYKAKYKIIQQKNQKDLFLTAPKNTSFNKTKTDSLILSPLAKYNINKNKESLLDIIHNKEIDLCMHLIKKLSEKKRKVIKSIILNDNINDECNGDEEIHNIIKNLKNFNLISNEIKNNYQRTPTSIDNLSMSTYYKTNISNNKSNSLGNNLKINMRNYSSADNNNQTEMKNTNINASKEIIKPAIKKSKNNLSKNINTVYNPKDEINFHTGFIRLQKNIDIYSRLNNRSSEKYHKKRSLYDDKKLLLAEIDEYRAIIKEIENRENKKLLRSKSVMENNKEKNEIVKDKLTEELNEIYLNQKKMFIDYIKDKANSNNKSRLELYKEAVNKNINRINKNKRIPNTFIDGYSLFDGKTNKFIGQYNYILGNKFHDKFQKSIKAKKLFQCVNELEDKYKENLDELLIKYNDYKKLFVPKLYSDKLEKEEHNKENDIDLDFRKMNNYMISKDSNVKETEKEVKKIENTSESKKDRIYKEYMDFKNQYKNKYLIQNDTNKI